VKGRPVLVTDHRARSRTVPTEWPRQGIGDCERKIVSGKIFSGRLGLTSKLIRPGQTTEASPDIGSQIRLPLLVRRGRRRRQSPDIRRADRISPVQNPGVSKEPNSMFCCPPGRPPVGFFKEFSRQSKALPPQPLQPSTDRSDTSIWAKGGRQTSVRSGRTKWYFLHGRQAYGPRPCRGGTILSEQVKPQQAGEVVGSSRFFPSRHLRFSASFLLTASPKSAPKRVIRDLLPAGGTYKATADLSRLTKFGPWGGKSSSGQDCSYASGVYR